MSMPSVTIPPTDLKPVAIDNDGTIVRSCWERRFLVNGGRPDISSCHAAHIVQAYVKLPHEDKERRIRSIDGKVFYIAVTRDIEPAKEGLGLHREEQERPLAKETFDMLLKEAAEGRVIEIDAYELPMPAQKTTFNVYRGNLSGLEMVQVEFETDYGAEGFKRPLWFGPEVSHLRQYRHSVLARQGLPDTKAIEEYLRAGIPAANVYALAAGTVEATRLIDHKLSKINFVKVGDGRKKRLVLERQLVVGVYTLHPQKKEKCTVAARVCIPFGEDANLVDAYDEHGRNEKEQTRVVIAVSAIPENLELMQAYDVQLFTCPTESEAELQKKVKEIAKAGKLANDAIIIRY